MATVQAELDSVLVEAIERSPIAVVAVGADGLVARWGAGAEALFGWTAAEVVGGRPVVKLREGDAVVRRKDGTPVRVRTVRQALIAGDGTAAGTVWLCTDEREREEAERALRRDALHDQLTGLPGRSLLTTELAALLAPSEEPSPRAAVLFVDLDGFKAVNDACGHAVGDRVLALVADRLRSAVRAGDLVTRVGGDEFVVVVPLQSGTDAVAEIERRIASALAEPVVIESLGVRAEVSASVGIAMADAGDHPLAVVAAADDAMYRAKRGGTVDLTSR